MSSLNNSLSYLGISNHKFAQQELYLQIHSHSYYEQSLMVKQIILIYIFRKKTVVAFSYEVGSDSLRPHGL